MITQLRIVWCRNYFSIELKDNALLRQTMLLSPNHARAAAHVDRLLSRPRLQVYRQPTRQTRLVGCSCGAALWREAITIYASFARRGDKDIVARRHHPIGVLKQSDQSCMSTHFRDVSLRACNYPVESLTKPYAEIWSIFEHVFADLSEDERDKLFGRNRVKIAIILYFFIFCIRLSIDFFLYSL